jgi:plasmid stabilization system protein ParE
MSRYVLTAEAQRTSNRFETTFLRKAVSELRATSSGLITGFRALARTPGQGYRREDLTPRPELRFWSVFSYRIDKKSLTIIAILHAKRDVERLLISGDGARAARKDAIGTISHIRPGDASICHVVPVRLAFTVATSPPGPTPFGNNPNCAPYARAAES